MTQAAWWRRFLVRGVFWRQFLRWAVLNTPLWIEPLVMAFWSLFFLLWGTGRRGVMRNLSAIKPGSSPVANFFRCYRVFWNYAWTIADNARFRELGALPDWEFAGWQYFEAMQNSGGAILLTAHMGSYDLGAQLFAEDAERHVVMVRAPEIDPQTRLYEEAHTPAGVNVAFNTGTSDLAIDLLHAVREGSVVAIQGDRVTPGISELPATLFGKPFRVPAGPFALAMSTGVPIYSVFVIRRGLRRYRLAAAPPFHVERTRDRDASLARAVAAWTRELESMVSEFWYQWFAFEPFWEEGA